MGLRRPPYLRLFDESGQAMVLFVAALDGLFGMSASSYIAIANEISGTRLLPEELG